MLRETPHKFIMSRRNQRKILLFKLVHLIFFRYNTNNIMNISTISNTNNISTISTISNNIARPTTATTRRQSQVLLLRRVIPGRYKFSKFSFLARNKISNDYTTTVNNNKKKKEVEDSENSFDFIDSINSINSINSTNSNEFNSFDSNSTDSKDSKGLKKATDGQDDVSNNNNIIRVLNKLAEREKEEKDHHRERAYRAAIKSIKDYPKEITSGKEAQKLKGIGKSISDKIDEILETGTCAQLQDSSQRELIHLFMTLPDIGRANAKKLIEKGYKSIEELEKDPDVTPLLKSELPYIEELNQEILREELEELRKKIVETLIKLDARLMSRSCGSFRRGASTSRELQLFITHQGFKLNPNSSKTAVSMAGNNILRRILGELKKSGFCTDYIQKGDCRYKAICQLPSPDLDKNPNLHRRIEFRISPYDHFWLGVLAWTGNSEFYRYLVKRAAEKNYILSDTIFAKKDPNTGETGPLILVESEQEIFELLDLEFVCPNDRNWKASIHNTNTIGNATTNNTINNTTSTDNTINNTTSTDNTINNTTSTDTTSDTNTNTIKEKKITD
ncbi:hypothetical protein Glove_134g214 [Diversispora epigaea]|uniref:DNA polymerase n=1 Tax=Diversispora epigaea TaxID=1348612 RepID=A0A397IZN4_9GLOM|nr:hypothetical protein Glove_134g214 [Diversispora epigaea]